MELILSSFYCYYLLLLLSRNIMIDFAFFAQQATPPPSGIKQEWIPLLIPILLIAAMWFLLIAPQRKKQKAHERMLNELKTGDKILTTGGIYATVLKIKNHCLVARIADDIKIEINKKFVHSKVDKMDKP